MMAVPHFPRPEKFVIINFYLIILHMLYTEFKRRVIRKCRQYLEVLARKKLKKNVGLWNVLQKYIKNTSSTGCSYSDYWVLYNYIKKHKPAEVLECGTGVSTIVMAYAMSENELIHKQKERGGRYINVLPQWKIMKNGMRLLVKMFQ
ncbi:MAG: hypothetical protein HYT27_00400 [Parcubacteria group bacterium]|nr:hypothetical protein [Parcubacteria group bacterium]